MQGLPRVLSLAGEFPFISDVDARQLQDPSVRGVQGIQGQVPPGPTQPGGGVAVNHTDQAQGLALRD